MRRNSPQKRIPSGGITYREVLFVSGLVVLGGVILALVGRRSSNYQQFRSCITNVRSLGWAIVMYSEDHDGVIQPYTNIESALATKTHKAAPTQSSEPKLLRLALHLYADEPNWFCPLDPVVRQKRYYLGIRHEFTSYAFPAFKDKSGHPAMLNDLQSDISDGLVWDAAGTPDSCESGLWMAGTRQWASNHPDGTVNVVLPNLSLRQLPALLPDGAGVAP